MDILGGITAATEGLKLVNELRKIDHEVDKTDLKIRLIDLADRLIDAKEALHDAKVRETELTDEIARLQEVSEMEDEDGCLYKTENGERVGEPFCNLCFVREGKLYRLKYVPYSSGSEGPDVYMANDPEHYWCHNCQKRLG